MDWWIHALYALGIVVVAFIGWRAWREEAGISGHDAMLLAIEQETKQSVLAERNDAYTRIARLKSELSQAAGQRDTALSRLHATEQSRRALKGANTRYRKRIEMLETEVAELRGEE